MFDGLYTLKYKIYQIIHTTPCCIGVQFETRTIRTVKAQRVKTIKVSRVFYFTIITTHEDYYSWHYEDTMLMKTPISWASIHLKLANKDLLKTIIEYSDKIKNARGGPKRR